MEEALSNGLSLEYVTKVLKLFGPLYLGLKLTHCKLVKCKDGDKKECCGDQLEPKFAGPAPILQGEQVFDSPISDLFLDLLVKALPNLLQNLAPKLVDLLVKLLTDALNKDKAAVKAAFTTALSESE